MKHRAFFTDLPLRNHLKQDIMPFNSMEQKTPKSNLLIQLAKQKAEAKKASANAVSFEKFKPGKSRNDKRGLLGPSWGGRNGQGKP